MNMNQVDAEEKAKRPRTVFGRIRTTAGGRAVKMELTKEKLVVRPLRSRRAYSLDAATVALFVMAHSHLK